MRRREVPKNPGATFPTSCDYSRNSLRITSLADPHHLTSVESHPYEKTGGGGCAYSSLSIPPYILPGSEYRKPFVCHTSEKSPAKFFACHTCKTASSNSFVCHTCRTPHPAFLPLHNPERLSSGHRAPHHSRNGVPKTRLMRLCKPTQQASRRLRSPNFDFRVSTLHFPAASPLPFAAYWHTLFRDMFLSGPFSGLLTDLYELTMAAGYVQNRFEARATFELFVRHLPQRRNYLVAAGLEQALDFLENVRFSGEDVAYLRALPFFRNVHSDFFDYLSRFQFTGDVWALPEGTVFFPGEPLLRVTAPIAEAQLVETGLLSILHFQTLIASKASRVTTAAAARPVVEFGSRRAHGMEAGVLAARAAFIGGCEGTSNTYAGRRFGIPVYGTQAHSWIMAHEDEAEAFRDFLEVFPEQSTLLVDTYDVYAAIEKIIALGRKPAGVRLDSGDVLADSQWVRKRLDQAGWNEVKIFASGELDEVRIETLLQRGARIDAFGVGTALSTSSDSPNIGVIYKLVEVEEGDSVRNAAKFSKEKITYPGRKQVFRFAGNDGEFSNDVIGLDSESFPGGDPLLVPVMRAGRRIEVSDQDPLATMKKAQVRHLADRASLPEPVLALREAEPPFPVRYSEQLEELRDQVRQSVVKAARI